MRRIITIAGTIFWILIINTGIFGQQQSKYLFTVARIQYGGGGDWYCDPSSLPNLLEHVSKNTNVSVSPKEARVKIGEELFNYPYAYITGHGNIKLTDEEVKILREYLTKGGFLHADDNYGMDKSFRREINRVFPDKELVEIPFSHEIFSAHYKFTKGLPKIHEHDGGPPKAFGLFHNKRLILFYSLNTDLGDGWEDPEVHNDPEDKRQAALKMGTNIVVYALTH